MWCCKLDKILLDFIYRCHYRTGGSVPPKSEMNDNRINKTLSDMKANHLHFVSLVYININSIRSKYYNIPYLIGDNLDIFTIAETKLDSSFTESQILSEDMKYLYRLGVSSTKNGLPVIVNKNIPSKYLWNVYFASDIQATPTAVNLKRRKTLIESI